MPDDPKTVLVIDDERQIAQVTCIRLKNAGYQTLMASDGIQGVEMAVAYLPDAILLDVRMPRMDGLHALAELRSRPETHDIPVVMLSASLIDKPAALDAGARFFLTKPFDATNLIAAICTAVEEASVRKEYTAT
jgi:DNA-binding response OmpR family regulator